MPSLHAWDAHRIVMQNPMDLGTIAVRLENGFYPSPAAVAEDVRLVWRNCRTFNEPGSDVYKSCDELAGFFDQLWKQAKLEKAAVSPRAQLICHQSCPIAR